MLTSFFFCFLETQCPTKWSEQSAQRTRISRSGHHTLRRKGEELSPAQETLKTTDHMPFRFKAEVSLWSSLDINLFKSRWIHQLSTEQPHWVAKKEVLNRVFWDERCRDEGTGSDPFRLRRFWPTEIASSSSLTAPGKKCRRTDRRSKSPFSTETPKRSPTKEWWVLTLGHKYAADAPKQPSKRFHRASQHPSIGDLLTHSALRPGLLLRRGPDHTHHLPRRRRGPALPQQPDRLVGYRNVSSGQNQHRWVVDTTFHLLLQKNIFQTAVRKSLSQTRRWRTFSPAAERRACWQTGRSYRLTREYSSFFHSFSHTHARTRAIFHPLQRVLIFQGRLKGDPLQHGPEGDPHCRLQEEGVPRRHCEDRVQRWPAGNTLPYRASPSQRQGRQRRGGQQSVTAEPSIPAWDGYDSMMLLDRKVFQLHWIFWNHEN